MFDNLRYLQDNEWAAEIPEDMKHRYFHLDKPDGIDIVEERKSNHRIVQVRRIDDDKHPVYGQYGLFALVELEPNSWILEYTGLVQFDELIDQDSDYAIHFHGPLSIDATACGNESRAINDFRGIVSKPNVAFDTYRCSATNIVKVGVFTLNNPIRPGEELVVTYGRDFWSQRGIHSDEPDWDPSWD